MTRGFISVGSKLRPGPSFHEFWAPFHTNSLSTLVCGGLFWKPGITGYINTTREKVLNDTVMKKYSHPYPISKSAEKKGFFLPLSSPSQRSGCAGMEGTRRGLLGTGADSSMENQLCFISFTESVGKL